MKAERQHKEPQQAAPIQSKREKCKSSFIDNRPLATRQFQLMDSIQQHEYHNGVVQRFYVGWFPDYPDDHLTYTIPNMFAVANFVNRLNRPAFSESTISSVYERATTIQHDMPYEGMDGQIHLKKELLFKCEDCKHFYPYQAMDIGHIIPWKSFLMKAGVINQAEANIAYNCLENLKLECSTCNRSHDFEPNTE